MRLIVSDGEATEYQYAIASEVTKVADYHDKLENTGVTDFSGVSFTDYISTLETTSPLGTLLGSIFSKSNAKIEEYTPVDKTGTETVSAFSVFVSNGHATDCRDKVITEVAGAVIDADIYATSIAFYATGFVNLMTKAGFYMVSRSYASLSNSVNTNWGDLFESADKYIVYAHGDNPHARKTSISRLDVVCAVGSGNGGVGSANSSSYGPGLEFYVDTESVNSYSTPRVMGMIAKLILNHPTWNFHDARQALRQSGSLWATGWVEDGGFGYVDYTTANGVTLGIGSPIRKDYTNVASKVTFEWKNNPQSTFSKTVIAIYDSEPTRTTTPTASEIIYEGTAETYEFNHSINSNKWFVFYSKDSSGNYSLVEDNVEPDYWFDKIEIALSHTESIITGKDGLVSINGTALVAIKEWAMDYAVDTFDSTEMVDSTLTHKSLLSGLKQATGAFSGTIVDNDSGILGTLTPFDSYALELVTNGLDRYSMNMLVNNISSSVSVTGEATVTANFTSNGNVTKTYE